MKKNKPKTRYEKDKSKAYYQNNKVAIRAKQKIYRQKNKDKLREMQKREKYKDARKKWYEEHKEYLRRYHLRYYRMVIKPKKIEERKHIIQALSRLMKDIKFCWFSAVI